MIQIKPIQNTNLRPDPHTLNGAIKSYPKDSLVEGDEWFIAPADLFKGDGTRYQKKGDKWLHATAIQAPGMPKVEVDGWMAVIHMGSSAGLPIILKDDTIPNDPPTGEIKIISAVITYSDGSIERLV